VSFLFFSLGTFGTFDTFNNMPIFIYKARDFQGVDHKGSIDTIDPSRAARILSKKGLVITSITEKRVSSPLFERLFNRVSFDELVIAHKAALDND
jgi:type II secretory pathway component PulF